MEKVNKEFGKYYLVELIDCDTEKLKFVKDVQEIFLRAAEKSKATVVKHFFHQYEPFGVTGIILICESHFSIHTWPEDKYVAFDILTCGEMYPELAIEEMKNSFQAKQAKVRIIPRGF